MRKLLNTLYVLSPDSYLALENQNVVIRQGGQESGRYPLLSLESILCFSNKGASVPLMAACAARGIQLSFLTGSGRYLCRVVSAERGNVLLRREQYRLADSPDKVLIYAKMILSAKMHNSILFLHRASREASDSAAVAQLTEAAARMEALKQQIASTADIPSLMGLEGSSSRVYFQAFDHMITQQKEAFHFHGRNKRPPLDQVNAMLSYGYTLLSGDCMAALEAVGLDACVGFLHQDHVGRYSLALDLTEEFRALIVDRFVIRLINLHAIRPEHFDTDTLTGAVLMNEAGKHAFLQAWQKKKQELFTHPTLRERMEWGLVPYAQAQLLARSVREQANVYHAFCWR